MLTSSNRLEADERDLHGENQSQNVKGRVASEQPVGESAHEEQYEHMERN